MLYTACQPSCTVVGSLETRACGRLQSFSAALCGKTPQDWSAHLPPGAMLGMARLSSEGNSADYNPIKTASEGWRLAALQPWQYPKDALPQVSAPPATGFPVAISVGTPVPLHW